MKKSCNNCGTNCTNSGGSKLGMCGDWTRRKSDDKPAKAQPPSKPKHIGLYRARLSCRIGRDALEGKNVPPRISPMEYALYNLLHAVEEMATAMEEQMKGGGK